MNTTIINGRGHYLGDGHCTTRRFYVEFVLIVSDYAACIDPHLTIEYHMLYTPHKHFDINDIRVNERLIAIA